jgi:hypothetical protein
MYFRLPPRLSSPPARMRREWIAGASFTRWLRDFEVDRRRREGPQRDPREAAPLAPNSAKQA